MIHWAALDRLREAQAASSYPASKDAFDECLIDALAKAAFAAHDGPEGAATMAIVRRGCALAAAGAFPADKARDFDPVIGALAALLQRQADDELAVRGDRAAAVGRDRRRRFLATVEGWWAPGFGRQPAAEEE